MIFGTTSVCFYQSDHLYRRMASSDGKGRGNPTADRPPLVYNGYQTTGNDRGDKTIILELIDSGLKQSETSKVLTISLATICRFLKRYQDSGSIENRHRSGRPRKNGRSELSDT
jgi:DNA invertase Pin-like site-specific DNA recombinase